MRLEGFEKLYMAGAKAEVGRDGSVGFVECGFENDFVTSSSSMHSGLRVVVIAGKIEWRCRLSSAVVAQSMRLEQIGDGLDSAPQAGLCGGLVWLGFGRTRR